MTDHTDPTAETDAGRIPERVSEWAAGAVGNVADPVDTIRIPITGSVGELPVPAPTKSRRTPTAIVGGVLGLALVVGGGAFAVSQLSGRSSNSPEDAVRELYSALTRSDAIGLAESLAPAERDVLLESGVPMIEQLKRLDILDPTLDLKKVPGLSLEVKEPTFAVETLRDDLAAVTTTAGSFRSMVDPAKLPLGSFVRDMAGEDLTGAEPESSESASPDDTPIVTVKEGGHWYVSFNYSAAYGADPDAPVPAKGAGVPGVGAATPEDAVRDLISSAANLDVRRLVELMPPDEMAAVHDYADRFVPDAEAAVADARKQYAVTFPELELESATKGDSALVTVKKFGVDAKFATTDGTNASASYRGSCLSITIDQDTKKRCGRELPLLLQDFTGEEIDKATLDQLAKTAEKGPNPKLGIVVVKRGGAWYVSPSRTMLDAATESLKNTTRADLEKSVKDVQRQIAATLDATFPSGDDWPS